MIALPPEDLAGVAALLRERVGLHVRAEGLPALRLALAARFEHQVPPPVPPDGYLALLRGGGAVGDEELRRLLPLVTVGKTSFFRDEKQFAALAALVPDLLGRGRGEGRAISIWSAGCATGEEPWSIAMTAAEAGARPGELELLATDVNPEAVAAAAEGLFAARRLREVPPPLVERWFRQEGQAFRVAPALRAHLAATAVHNLASARYPRPRTGAWDVIFCRNVIIYFDVPTVKAVLARFLEALAPGGWLFLGYSESLFRLFDGFELTEVAGAFLYRRPEHALAPGRTPAPALPRYAPGRVAHAAVRPPEGIAAALTPLPSPRPRLSAQEVLDLAVQLVAAGRFVAARDRLEAHLREGSDDLGVRLTLAHLHDVLRAPERAGPCYRASVEQEPLSAEAHLFYGIHLLGVGEPGRAAEELGRALFLDPDLAVAHYFAGRCHEALGDRERARLAWHNAIDAAARRPAGHRQVFIGHYPDLPEDGAAFARAARYALAVG
ncbi:MAG TPA: CheR family methyltransferase [Anaeromyxobacteraceae bacterium]|nr:CheR family methyltransferase [Anaeromyxobacteraceae bacterium]